MTNAALSRRILGAQPDGDRTLFGAHASTADQCALRLFDARGRGLSTHPMERASSTGPGGSDAPGAHFGLELPGVGPGARYKFVVGDRELPDPYARWLPDGVHGPAEVVAPGHVFRHPRAAARPLREHVVYELHVGTFSEAGTYDGVLERLDWLAELGVTTLELLPLAAFAGERGWGYDGVAPYAPFAPYGRPDDLRRLVDEAHGRSLSVWLDVVYNHLGPAGNYLAAYAPEYFTQARRNAWGDAPDFTRPITRRWAIENAAYWIREFQFDGLRLDAVHAIHDPSPRHVLAELRERVRQEAPGAIVVAEDERNDPACIQGLGIDAMWADGFHHQVRVTLTGERDGYYAAYAPGVEGLARVIEQGWLYEGQVYPPSGEPRGKPARELPAECFVYCIQNHDQIGNRALGTRLCEEVPLDRYLLASTLLLFLPMTPLLFMGQEWAASSPFLYFTDHDAELGRLVSAGRREEFAAFSAFSDPVRRAAIPDPQALDTFTRSKLSWAERGLPDHARALALYRSLLALRRDDPVLRSAGRGELSAASAGDVLIVRRWAGDDERVLIANFGDVEVPLSIAGVALDARVVLRSAAGTVGAVGAGSAAIVAREQGR
jgi:maltooligosyltrehalose trehalohydrolase